MPVEVGEQSEVGGHVGGLGVPRHHLALVGGEHLQLCQLHPQQIQEVTLQVAPRPYTHAIQ